MSSKAKRIAMLERRAAHLEHRIANYVGKSDSYDRAELTALSWALNIVKGAMAEGVDDKLLARAEVEEALVEVESAA